jgi:pimeloyl-ACP methyl ester carboxylesterase
VTTATQTHTEQTIEVGGGTVRVLKGGSGHPVVVLHHSTGNPGWASFHEQLARSAEVFAPDMPGYGQSSRPEWAREPRDLAILLLQALDKMGLGTVTLVGTGFGGFIAAEMVSMNQARFDHVILIGAAGLQPEEGEILDEMLVDFEEYVKAGFVDEAAYHRSFGETLEPAIKDLWDFSREMSARVTWKPYMFSRRLAPLLREVRTPALLIWGANDAVVPPVCGRQYQAAFANAKLEVVANAGHLVEYEQPEKVAALISAFSGKA